MQTWLIILILLLVTGFVLITFVAVNVTILISKTGFCYTDTKDKKECILGNKNDCKANNGTHYDTYEDCQKQLESKKETYSNHCSC